MNRLIVLDGEEEFQLLTEFEGLLLLQSSLQINKKINKIKSQVSFKSSEQN